MSNNNPLISIIVPIYQVEQYLKACLDSILNQSLKDFELILIDDGSIDNGGIIADEYAKKDERIIVIHQENQGLSAARNAGLDIAKGKYITCIDSDDILISKYYLQYLYDNLIRNDAQITMYPLFVFSKDEDLTEITDHAKEFLITDGVDIWTNFNRPSSFYMGCAYGKLYERSLFDNVRYPVGHYVEDNAVIHRLVYPCKKIVILDKHLYGYRLRKDGIMGSAKKDAMVRDIILAFEDRRHYFLENNHPELAKVTEQEMLWHLRSPLLSFDKDMVE